MDVLRQPARIESLEPFRTFVLRQIEGNPRLETLVFDVELVLEEALTNVISYAYGGGEGEIEVRCELTGPGELRIEVRDWGAPFNPLDNAPPCLDADLDDRPIGGLGIHLVRQLAREVHYRYEEGANILTLCFSETDRQE